MSTNITQIAKFLNIAPSTVSRALKKPELVSLETRTKVLSVAENFGYLRQLRDNSIVTPSSKLIGVIVADLTNSFSNQIVKAVHDFLEDTDYQAIVACNYEKSSSEAKILKQWAALNLCGVIVMPTAKFTQIAKSSLKDIPIVFVDRSTPGLAEYDCVVEDNQDGIMQAMTHLNELGHKRIAFITGNRKVYTFKERALGIRNCPFEAEIIEMKAESYEELFIGAFEATNNITMYHKNCRPTALIGANNAITSGILYALNLKGMKIPDDFSVLSYGDSNWCRFYPTPITSISQPTEEMGRTAAKVLISRIKGQKEKAQKILLKSMLLRRASTAKIDL